MEVDWFLGYNFNRNQQQGTDVMSGLRDCNAPLTVSKEVLMKNRIILILLVLSFSAIGCNEDPGGPNVNPKIVKNMYLKKVESCNDVTADLKERILTDMEEKIYENLNSILQGEHCYIQENSDRVRTAAAPQSDVLSDKAGGGSSGPSEHSETNVQVAGVDEADFIKNDGEYIYILANNKFQIIKSWPPEEARRISDVSIDGTPKRLYVHNDLAIIYSSLDSENSNGRYNKECTYGYNCEFLGDGYPLEITIFDISDRSNPRLVRKSTFSGSYLNSRRIDNMVHTVVVFDEMNSAINRFSYWPSGVHEYYCKDLSELERSHLISLFENLKHENREIVEESNLFPSVDDTIYLNQDQETSTLAAIECDDLYISDDNGESYLSLVSFNLSNFYDVSMTTILGEAGAVYASNESLYIASRQHRDSLNFWFFEDNSLNDATTIHKFKLKDEDNDSEYRGSGVVKGKVLNQFSMDEYEENLRIATTVGWMTYNTVSVLKEEKGDLVQIGMIDNIAPGEDIRSARFNEEMGFIVTFKKTDPLFVIDFSDPENPIIKGELKIPGFSTYIHMMDDNHLLTIGYDADDMGSFAWFQGIMLQIFNVTDPNNPELIHKEVIGTRGSTSDAATNHLAFNYFASMDQLAIPIVVCEGGSGGSSRGELAFNGLKVYETTIEDGFNYLGGVSHEISGDKRYGYCNNWWTDSNSDVKRSIFMDDYVFSVAMDRINIANVNDFSNLVGSVELDK